MSVFKWGRFMLLLCLSNKSINRLYSYLYVTQRYIAVSPNKCTYCKSRLPNALNVKYANQLVDLHYTRPFCFQPKGLFLRFLVSLHHWFIFSQNGYVVLLGEVFPAGVGAGPPAEGPVLRLPPEEKGGGALGPPALPQPQGRGSQSTVLTSVYRQFITALSLLLPLNGENEQRTPISVQFMQI